jgi:predicted O-linked N-acetylglucosamine transferase (SPINDLY family)
MSQLTVDQAIQLALQHQQANQLAEAESLFRQILEAYPDQADAHHLLGGVYLQANQQHLAEKHVRKAIGLRAEKSFFLTLGLILQNVKRYEDALLVYKDAITRYPDYPEIYVHQGVVLSMLGRFEEAAKAFEQALRLAPNHVQAQGNLGIVLCHLKRYEEAIWILRAAVARAPKSGDFHASLGAALHATGQVEAALLECKEALNLNPSHVQALTLTSFILQKLGRVKEAVEPARQAALMLPDFVAVQINCGECLRHAELSDEAAEHYERVLARKLEAGDLHNNLGNVYKDQGRLDEAIVQFRRALELESNPLYHSNLIYSLHYHPGYSPEAIFQEMQVYDRTYVQAFAEAIRPHEADRTPGRKLRIGYMSADFRQHALGLYLMPLMEKHDREQYEIYCYADVTKADFYTFRHRQFANVWRDTHGLTDEEITEAIRRDKIDILIDLHQHMGGNRLLIFARRPAPVQIGFAGYPNSSGVSTIDYRLTDPYLEPAEEKAFPSSEVVLRLPKTWWCYHAVAEVPVNELPALGGEHFTFGNLNNFCKLNTQTYDLWAQVMHAVDHSRLILLAPEGKHRDRTVDYLAKQGISPERVKFVNRTGSVEYYKYYHEIDMCIDSFPYNGHTTSMDSFFMGVPVTSYRGSTAWGRGTWSQASNLGLPELVARTPEDFVRRSVELAHDIPRLVELRRSLRERMRASPLMDAEGFARGVEAAYRQAWEKFCR